MLSFGLVSCGFSATPLVCEDDQTPWVNNICLWHGLRDDNPDLEGGKGPIEDALHQIDCGEESAFGPNVQSGADVTVGSSGLLDATLSPVETHFNEAGMCVVNVHWHLGAEHKNVGTYDIDGEEWMEQHGKTKPKAHGANVVPGHGYGYGNVKGAVPLGEHDDIDPGNFCPGYDEALLLRSPACAQLRTAQLHVGFTYEIHWPHSSLGACGTPWQMQSHFMDGVLCKANEADMDPGDAVAAVLDGTAKIGVQGMVVMVVNDAAYDYPEWNMMEGWHPDLVTDVAIYQALSAPF
ncbi:hypothetical protein EMIHUDRAFT_241514 [Emiliania huxleyi CCMP1516]|uniref:Uncharacterized protein n=2 Tax=Emiliania huxleyi TaxID=2903 RepID=A0A0D3JCF4_EMIH1|nr:hypothetical protein EMIHUDRAFT_241514 [Emiliania huxleyi CCMP1516]EOD21189.1 hypothetical protein EMIHUDRAFT_241514 [Emiliania huxleyi CCMP1516]|eukprot:XP_005773618.1 hypothetical protein EMIHUDRAFT_241514 [Emiliania huxleyi CCMP1516]